MSRSLWKGNFLKKHVLKKKIKKIWSRSSSIPFKMMGQIISVYNGKEFKKIYVSREKIGYKFGAFSFTRKFTRKVKNIKKIK